jgi:hypothetical protein
MKKVHRLKPNGPAAALYEPGGACYGPTPGVERVENPVWEVYPLATHFGGGSGKKAWSEIYESDELDAKVIGEGPTYEAAWEDAARRIHESRGHQ